MALTTAQQATLKAYIEANPTWMAYSHNGDGAFAVALELTRDRIPDFYVWRTNVTEAEMTSGTSAEGTDWSWTAFIGRSAGEQRGFDRMFRSGAVDASKQNVRQGFVDIFSGGTGTGQRAHMAAISKRRAIDVEALFSTGTGSLASPGTMAIEGRITYRDVLQAMGW